MSSMGAVGTYEKSCEKLKTVLKDIGLTPSEITYTTGKIVNICIRATYYIFCMRNKDWSKPDLLAW